MNTVLGGVCAPKGFSANGLHCGIRKNRDRRDLALIASENIAAAACVYTQNKVKGAPIYVTMEHVKDGYARAIICNSGNANTCAPWGMEAAEQMCGAAAVALGAKPEDIIVASTGVIGRELDVGAIKNAVPALAAGLSTGAEGAAAAAEAIMTTDTRLKEYAVSFSLSGAECKLGGMAKGSGMIHPNMATMLAFLTTDAAISPEMLRRALCADVKDSFNMISVDGDTSTNDMVSVLANGRAGNPQITGPGEDYDAFCAALRAVTARLAREIARDGEGATKLLECAVRNAPDEDSARLAARAVVSSNLFKSAMFGGDANWGRILCALGYSGAEFDPEKTDISLLSSAGAVKVCENGEAAAFSEELASMVLARDEIFISVDLKSGEAGAVAWGCDLTYEYVKINGDYRT